jgi:hypothetical protein
MAPILGYQWPGEKFTIDMHASSAGIGGVLSQIQSGQEQVVAYYSMTVSRGVCNYCVTWQELLAIVKMLENIHKYLYRQVFHLHTNHSSLKWLLSFKDLKGQTACWV